MIRIEGKQRISVISNKNHVNRSSFVIIFDRRMRFIIESFQFCNRLRSCHLSQRKSHKYLIIINSFSFVLNLINVRHFIENAKTQHLKRFKQNQLRLYDQTLTNLIWDAHSFKPADYFVSKIAGRCFDDRSNVLFCGKQRMWESMGGEKRECFPLGERKEGRKRAAPKRMIIFKEKLAENTQNAVFQDS